MSDVIPCGGCGATSPRQRCIGCMHDFGTPDSAWVRKYLPASGIAVAQASETGTGSTEGKSPAHEVGDAQ